MSQINELLKRADLVAKPIYKPAEVARMFGVSRETIRHWCEMKDFPNVRLGSHRRFDHQALAQWVERQHAEMSLR